MKSVVFFLNSCSILQHGISLRVVFCINKIQSVQCVFQGSMWAWLIKNGDTKSRGTVSFIKVTDISTKLLSSRYPDQFLLVLSWSIPACVIRINSCLCYPDQFLLVLSGSIPACDIRIKSCLCCIRINSYLCYIRINSCLRYIRINFYLCYIQINSCLWYPGQFLNVTVFLSPKLQLSSGQVRPSPSHVSIQEWQNLYRRLET